MRSRKDLQETSWALLLFMNDGQRTTLFFETRERTEAVFEQACNAEKSVAVNEGMYGSSAMFRADHVNAAIVLPPRGISVDEFVEKPETK